MNSLKYSSPEWELPNEVELHSPQSHLRTSGAFFIHPSIVEPLYQNLSKGKIVVITTTHETDGPIRLPAMQKRGGESCELCIQRYRQELTNIIKNNY